jgi:glyoxylase-like metal-dependent hydrolase (beta-lactamase superfamily II)
MEIVEGIHRVDGVYGNVYLIIDGGELTLVDTGMPKNAQKILDYVHRVNERSASISRILLTHCHVDHAGSASELKQLTKAKVGIHREDADFVSGRKSAPTPKGFNGVLFKVMSPFYRFKPVESDVILQENDKVGNLTVVHTPGHTPGSVSYYDPERKALFVGDTIRFVNGKLSGPNKRFSSDMQQALQSVKKISRLNFDLMLSGHGDPLKSNASEKVKELSDSLEENSA